MIDIIDVDNQKWNYIINQFQNKDIYYTSEFFKVSTLLDEGIPILFFFKTEDGMVAFPFIKRKIHNEKGLNLWDVTTPYGYGGPIFEVTGSETILFQNFDKNFSKYCIENNIITEFIRFHPIIKGDSITRDNLVINKIRHTICLNLKESDDLMDSIPAKTRNKIRKAMKNNISVKELDFENYFDDFYSIYVETMKRNDANDYYYFSESYFRTLFNVLGESIKIWGAFKDNILISVTLIMSYGDFIHYHLSGGKKEYLQTGVTYLLLFEIANWAKINGFRYFHLGGGYEGDFDGLFQFKRSFSKNNPLSFSIGKKIHNKSIYDELVISRKIDYDNGFFPLYRKR